MMTLPPAPPRPESNVGATIAAVIVGLWAVFLAVTSQGVAWLTDQVILTLGVDTPVLVWPVAGLVIGLLAGGPALALALIPRHPAVRAAGRAWTIGAGALGLGTALRVIPGQENEWYLLALAVCATTAWLLLRRRPGATEEPAATDPTAPAPAAYTAPGTAAPTAPAGYAAPGTAAPTAPAGYTAAAPTGYTAPGTAAPTAPAGYAAPGTAAPTGYTAATQAGHPAGQPTAPAFPTGDQPTVAAPPPWTAHSPAPSSAPPWPSPVWPPPHGTAAPVTPGVPASGWWGVAAGLLVLLPFLWAGGLGGRSETILAIAAAAAIGGLVSSTLDSRYWTAYEPGPVRRILLGGLVAGTALTLIAGGAGASGAQLLLILVLPPLGFAAGALRTAGPLIGVAAFGPLAFMDPVEFTLYLTPQDVPYWMGIAALIGFGIAVLVGLATGFTSKLLATARKPLAIGAAAVMLLGATAVYAVGGQPGFHGDQLFVVLKEQAPLTDLPSTPGLGPARDARVKAVYDRLVAHANLTQEPLRQQLREFGITHTPYYLVNAILVDGGPELRLWLENHEDVDRVLVDQRLRPLPVAPDTSRGNLNRPPSSPLWNIQMVGAVEAWQQGRGNGIVVGSSDSGVDGQHPALADGFRGGDDSWYDPWDGTTSPVDTGGHGTHTLGTAVGRLNIGVAPQAQWVGCVNLDRNMGSPSLYLECMQFMLAPFPKGGNPMRDGRPARAPHVLTNSWGCPELEGCDFHVFQPATDALFAAGIAFVAAAGNSGDRCGSIDTAPATDPSSFTVAAVDENRAVTPFSSRGIPASGKPDVSAPGAEIVSAMPGNTYAALDGTSMATPHVAGLIALLWSVHPELVGDLETTYQLVRESATPVSSPPTCGDLEDGGAGIVNAARALAEAAG